MFIVNFDVDVVWPQCLGDWTYTHTWFLQVPAGKQAGGVAQPAQRQCVKSEA